MEDFGLRVTAEPAGTRVVKLTIETSEERVQQEMRRVAGRIAREARIPGFRKGKTPYRIIVQRYGEDTIRQEAADELAEQVYREALEQQEITPYAPGTLVEMELAPLRFTFTVPLPPVVELGNYRRLRVKASKVRVAKREIEEVLERFRQDNAVLEPAQGRGAQPGDVLVIDVEGRAEDGTVFLKDKEAELLLDPETEQPAPGFHHALESMTVEEERVFRLKMPEGRPSEEAEFTVRLLRLFQRILPAVDDDLARTVGSFDSLKDLQKDIKERLLQQKQQEGEEEYTQRVVEAVVEQARVEYPPEAVEEVVDDLLEQLGRRVQRERRMSLSDYLKVVGKEEEQLREELWPQAEERLRHSLVLSRVVEAENLQVDDEAVTQRIGELSEPWGDQADAVREQLQTEENRLRVVNELLVEKVIQRLIAIARGEAKSEEE